jgi:hypothetical protein
MAYKNDDNDSPCTSPILLLNYNGVFTNTQKMLSNQGKKAVFSFFSKIQDDYFNTETLLSLFDTYVNSIVNYGCVSSDLILPRFLKMTTFVFNKFTCRLYSFEHTFTTLIIF